MEQTRTRGALRWAVGGLMGLGLSVLTVHSAEAATRTVPTDPGCGTIQDCVNTSAPGDKILIEPGIYAENVVVDKRLLIAGNTVSGPLTVTSPGRPNTTFARRQCANREAVIVDAAPGGVRGIGFDIQADRVSLICMTVRQSDNAVQALGFDFLSLEHFNGLTADEEVVDVVGDNTLIYMSGFAGGGDGFDQVQVTGDNTRVIQSASTNAGLDCWELDGDNVSVQNSRASECENADGFDTDGAAPRYVRNQADNAEDAGFDIECTGDCGNARVERNTSERNLVGFDLENSVGGPGRMQVLNNQAVRNQDDGFQLNGSFITLLRNRADINGAIDADSANIEVNGDDNRILENLARFGGNDGILVHAGSDNNVIRDNQVFENARDGIDVEGDGNQVRRNKAFKNEAEGLENNGANNFFRDNRAEDNRIDCAADAALAPGSGANFCADGSNFGTLPEIEKKTQKESRGKEDKERRKS